VKKALSVRLNPVIIDLLDKVALEGGTTRTALIESIFLDFLKEHKGQETENAIRKHLEFDRIDRRVKEINRDLRKYRSHKKTQRYIDEEKYAVGLEIYNRWRHYYSDIEGKPLNPPVDIKSL
jgi:hypothetical protein